MAIPFTQTGTADATGLILLAFRPTARQNWEVQQVSVDGARPGATAIGSGALIDVLLDNAFIATLATPKDVAAGAPYVDVTNGRTLYVKITGAVVGSSAQATILYEETVKQVSA